MFFFPAARLLGNRVFISNIMHSGGDIITDKYGGWGGGLFKLCDDPAIIDWSTEIAPVYFYKYSKILFYFSSIVCTQIFPYRCFSINYGKT